LVKVFQKADHWSIKVLAVTMMVLFTGFRYDLIPAIFQSKSDTNWRVQI
jgi:chitin synthase